LNEALAFNVPRFTEDTLVRAYVNRERLVFDLEIYENYFLAAFMSLDTGLVTFFETYPGKELETGMLSWVMHHFTTVGFNSIQFDLPLTALALAGRPTHMLKWSAHRLIVQEERGSDILREEGVSALDVDHIDLIEVAPLRASLKIYGGRLHCPRMQDLPFHPNTYLSAAQIAIVRWYCVNDLITTAYLYGCLKQQLDLRESMSREYALDLRSKSDAQIAEAIIGKEVAKLNGKRCTRPTIEVGTRYRYKVPAYMHFETPLMNWALERVANTDFVVAGTGAVGMPPELAEMKLTIANGVYRMGIGGLHSSEQTAAHIADAEHDIVDRDVTSYYPMIILNQELYPQHLGTAFLKVYRKLVERRLEAKAAGNKIVADSLKITINGSFGKLGSMYSILYAPDLLIQVTITGQLSLLMLIERLELRGITVVSANTDGIVIKCAKPLQPLLAQLISEWEKETGFETEETAYRAVYSRDVNNYIAVKPDGKIKSKGAYANPWVDAKNPETRLHKNPAGLIAVEAATAKLTTGTAVRDTVRGCKDIRKFVTVRTVKGGAVQDGEYLGKSVRWYYSTTPRGEMVYALTGNKVPKSDGARPMMDLPQVFPDDVDYEWYEREAERILVDLGYSSE
jgi:hypothetical protein